MAEAARARFELQDVLVVHRYGPIAPGEAIVFVATAAEHRRAAFEAADYLMDYLEDRGPVLEEGARPRRGPLDRAARAGTSKTPRAGQRKTA